MRGCARLHEAERQPWGFCCHENAARAYTTAVVLFCALLLPCGLWHQHLAAPGARLADYKDNPTHGHFRSCLDEELDAQSHWYEGEADHCATRNQINRHGLQSPQLVITSNPLLSATRPAVLACKFALGDIQGPTQRCLQNDAAWVLHPSRPCFMPTVISLLILHRRFSHAIFVEAEIASSNVPSCSTPNKPQKRKLLVNPTSTPACNMQSRTVQCHIINGSGISDSDGRVS